VEPPLTNPNWPFFLQLQIRAGKARSPQVLGRPVPQVALQQPWKSPRCFKLAGSSGWNHPPWRFFSFQARVFGAGCRCLQLLAELALKGEPGVPGNLACSGSAWSWPAGRTEAQDRSPTRRPPEEAGAKAAEARPARRWKANPGRPGGSSRVVACGDGGPGARWRRRGLAPGFKRPSRGRASVIGRQCQRPVGRTRLPGPVLEQSSCRSPWPGPNLSQVPADVRNLAAHLRACSSFALPSKGRDHSASAGLPPQGRSGDGAGRGVSSNLRQRRSPPLFQRLAGLVTGVLKS